MEKSKYEEALERVGAIFVSFTCNDDGDKDYCHLRDNNDYEETYNVLQDAVAKAEKYDEMMKQKKVLNKEYDDRCFGELESADCPNCGKEIATVWADTHSVKVKHCPECGQALDWEEKKK